MASGNPSPSPTSTRWKAPWSTSWITLVRSSTQGHANADFVGSPGHGVGRDAVQSHCRQQKGDDPEKAGKTGYGALLIETEVDLLLHGPDAGESQVGIHLRQCPHQQGLEGAGSRTGHQHDSADKMRSQLDLF